VIIVLEKDFMLHVIEQAQ